MSYLEWSTTAGSNATADANINWAEGQFPSTVNNSNRAEMAALASYFQGTGGALTTGGTGSAYTVTLADAPTAYTASMCLLVKFHAVSASTTATININGLGAKTLKTWGGSTLPAADYIPVNAYGLIKYDGANMRVFLPSIAAVTTQTNAFTADQTIKSTDAGAGVGPTLKLYRDSASPATDDILGRVSFSGKNSVGSEVSYAQQFALIKTAGSGIEDGRLVWSTTINGSLSRRMNLETGLWMDGATGGSQGAGTLNATALYENGTSLSAKYSPIAGSSSITTVGTITTGTWTGTNIAVANGGTGASTVDAACDNIGAARLNAGTNTFTGNVEHGSFSSTGASSGKLIDTSLGGSNMDSSRAATGSLAHFKFYNPNGQVGSIQTSGTSTAFNTASDAELKDAVTDVDKRAARAKVKSGRPVEFEFKNERGIKHLGFLAQEMHLVHPDAVTPGDDGTPWMMDHSKLVPVLWAALQDAIDRIEALENA